MASKFPTQSKMTAIVQQASLNRKGLVADCIFPPVKTPCRFDYIDWTNAANITLVEDAVGCKSDVREIDPEAFVIISSKVEDHALQQSMGDCCVQACGDDAVFAAKKEQGKTIQLMNRLLINRERAAIALATDETKYTANGTSGSPVLPGAATAVNEGGLFYLSKTNLADANYALLKWFMPIQTNNFMTGRRTKAIMSQATLNQLLVHPNFLGAGCIVEPKTTLDKVASLLGVDEICIGGAAFNNGVGSTVSMQALWPNDYILFTASYEFLTSDEQQVAFGISAYDKGFRVNNYIKEEKGPDAGVEMQKMAHDYTPVVLSYKAATLVKLV